MICRFLLFTGWPCFSPPWIVTVHCTLTGVAALFVFKYPLIELQRHEYYLLASLSYFAFWVGFRIVHFTQAIYLSIYVYCIYNFSYVLFNPLPLIQWGGRGGPCSCGLFFSKYFFGFSGLVTGGSSRRASSLYSCSSVFATSCSSST